MTGDALTGIYAQLHATRRAHNEALATGQPYLALATDHAHLQRLAQTILDQGDTK